jgi:hypothetical protein
MMACGDKSEKWKAIRDPCAIVFVLDGDPVYFLFVEGVQAWLDIK